MNIMTFFSIADYSGFYYVFTGKFANFLALHVRDDEIK